MKKLIVLLALVSFALVVTAADDMNYVCVGGKTYFSKDVKIGLTNARIVTENGMTLKAPLKNVDSYMVNGRYWERLPLICNDGKEKGTALMEFITQRNGLRLYKYNTSSENSDLGCQFYDKSNFKTMYFVYKDGKLYLRIDAKNAETAFPFFGVKIKK